MMKNVKIPPQIFFYGIGTIIIIWAVYLLFRRVGLIKEKTLIKAEKETAQNIENLFASKYFNPNLYKSTGYGYAHLASNQTVNDWADKIKRSFGWFNDNEEQIYLVFRAISNKIQISQVSDAYAQLFSSDLLGDLKQYLNEKELSFVWSIIDKKPIS